MDFILQDIRPFDVPVYALQFVMLVTQIYYFSQGRCGRLCWTNLSPDFVGTFTTFLTGIRLTLSSLVRVNGMTFTMIP